VLQVWKRVTGEMAVVLSVKYWMMWKQKSARGITLRAPEQNRHQGPNVCAKICRYNIQ